MPPEQSPPSVPDSLGDSDKRFLWLVLAAWICFAVVWRADLDVAWFTLSADDIFRTEHAIQVANGEILPSDLWPPLPFWLAGTLVRVGLSALTAPSVVNLGATTLSLLFAADTARILLPNRLAPTFTVMLAGTLPWTLWLAWSSMSEPVAMAAHLAVIRGLAEWRTNRGVVLVVGGLCLGGLTRYESWGDFVVVLALAWFVRSQVRWRWAFVPLMFPVFWLLLQWSWLGNPVNFAAAARSDAMGEQEAAAGWVAGSTALRQLWQAGDIVIPLGILGWWGVRTRASVRAPMVFGCTSLLLQLGVAVVGFGEPMPRHYVGHAAFLAIGAAGAAGTVRGSLSIVAVTALTLGRMAMFLLHPPPLYVTRELQAAVAQLAMVAPNERRNLLVEFEDFSSLAVPLLLPSRTVIWDREPVSDAYGGEDLSAGSSVLLLPRSELFPWLKRERVGSILTVTPTGRFRTKRMMKSAFDLGGYSFFAVPAE